MERRVFRFFFIKCYFCNLLRTIYSGIFTFEQPRFENMKKWIFAAFTAAAIFATTGVSAQKHITKPEMTPELTTEAEAALQSYKATAEEKEQNKVLKQLYKKKEEQDLLIIGYYFLDKGELELAEKTAEKLYDEDAKFVPGLILSGDVQVAKKNWGEAGRKYDEALNYDPEVIEAYIKKAQVYKNVEPQTAIGALMELKNIDPSLVEADRELAAIYYKVGDMKKAIESYEAYMQKDQNPSIDAYREYAIALFADTAYAKALEVVNKALPKAPKDISLNRLKFYCEVETGDFGNAFTDKDKLFGQYNDTMYNHRDYMYLGRLEKEMKMYKESVADYEKAIMLKDQKKRSDITIYKALSEVCLELPDYDKAIKYYKTFADSTGTELSAIDLLEYGKIYYQAASAVAEDTLLVDKKNAYIAAGDTIFAQLDAKRKDTHYGPFWRARINTLKDPSNPLDDVKSFYEETLKRVEGKDNASVEVEANRYLAFYYMKKDNNELSKQYCEKVLAVDPDDKLSATILKVVSQQ